jgi:hypothetical protein
MLDRLQDLTLNQFFQACAMQRFSQLCRLISVGEGRVFRARMQKDEFSAASPRALGAMAFLPPAIRHHGRRLRSALLTFSSI